MTIKIGVLSDTHIPTRASNLPEEIFEIFQNVQYIIHAGDYVSLSVIEELEKIAPVIGCHGNMDPYDLKNQLPRIATLEVEENIIKIIHDLSGRSQLKKLQKSGPVDIIIHGHTHRMSVEKLESVLILNPGSATNSFLTPDSVGLLYLAPNDVDYELIELK
ncbi:MAG: metallophosphoesterase family protein [Candidatus Helarchaeota archaeon]